MHRCGKLAPTAPVQKAAMCTDRNVAVLLITILVLPRAANYTLLTYKTMANLVANKINGTVDMNNQ